MIKLIHTQVALWSGAREVAIMRDYTPLHPASWLGADWRIVAVVLIFIILSLLGIIFNRVERYLISYKSPEDGPANFLAQWRDGALFVAKQFFTFKGLLFSLPFIILGIIFISGTEYYYFANPGIMPHFFATGPSEGGSILLLIGMIFLVIALAVWKSTSANIEENSRSMYSIKRIDSYALFGLSGISVIFILLSIIFANPKSWNCALISFIVAVVSAGVALWRRSDV